MVHLRRSHVLIQKNKMELPKPTTGCTGWKIYNHGLLAKFRLNFNFQHLTMESICFHEQTKLTNAMDKSVE